MSTAPGNNAGTIQERICRQKLDCSSSSEEEEGYVSPYCCSSDDEHDQRHRDLLDELPAFSTRSPSGRSLSPIDLDPDSPPGSFRNSSAFDTPPAASESPAAPGHGFVSLEEINARIGLTPPDSERSRSRLNLETIFEDKFLETPPKKGFESRTGHNLLRRSLRNRVLFGGSGSSPATDRDQDAAKEKTSPGGIIDGLSDQFDSKCTFALD
uniref:Uncharacterized protein n=1 Tax=Culex tarsalis TaxID=7177 RepID=A0A1Q3EYP2_CULTA